MVIFVPRELCTQAVKTPILCVDLEFQCLPLSSPEKGR